MEYVKDDGTLVPSDDLWRSKFKGRGVPQTGVTGSETLHRMVSADRVVTGQTFSDCGHDDYRPGIVLDPFAGSGTTLAVATGHGRDAIGIDLDERNYELALDRVGPLVLSRAA